LIRPKPTRVAVPIEEEEEEECCEFNVFSVSQTPSTEGPLAQRL